MPVPLAVPAAVVSLVSLLAGAAMSGQSAGPTTGPATQPAAIVEAEGPIMVEVAESALYVNAMGRAKPAIPEFPALEPKPGHVRGHVRDVHGKPLKGARIGIRSSAVGGGYSGAQGVTNAEGYYEFEVPWGACHFYNAGYAIDWGEDGRAALGLHPADGELDSFASADGCVENFVLLPWGVGDRDGAQDNPGYAGNYYGGAIHVDYSVSEGRVFDQPTDLPPDATIELTLTPKTPLLDGSAGRAIVVRKRVGTRFYVLNLPVAAYEISAKLADGTALKMRETGPYSNNAFGLEPKEATGSAKLLFRPDSAKAEMATPAHGNWQSIDITLSRPES